MADINHWLSVLWEGFMSDPARWLTIGSIGITTLIIALLIISVTVLTFQGKLRSPHTPIPPKWWTDAGGT